MIEPGSRWVDWWLVHVFVQPVLRQVGSWPMAGTAAWSELGGDDPRKVAAVYDAARHHALRVDTAQARLADASHDVAGAADWKRIARDLQCRSGIYIERRTVD